MSADKQLKSYIDRVLRLKEEQDTLGDDIREVYAEAKSEGYDKTIMGKLVAHLRKVAKSGEDTVSEQEMNFDTYLQAYHRASGTAVATHTHEEKFDPLTGEFLDDKETEETLSADTRAEGREVGDGVPSVEGDQLIDAAASLNVSDDDAPRADGGADIVTKHTEIASQASVTGDDSHSSENVNPRDSGGSGANEGGEDVDGSAERANISVATSSGPDEKRATYSPEEANEMDRDTEGSLEAGSAPAGKGREAIPAGPEGVDLNHAEAGDSPVPSFLRKPPSPLRPHCRNPGETCGGSGRNHCHTCAKAMRERAPEEELA